MLYNVECKASSYSNQDMRPAWLFCQVLAVHYDRTWPVLTQRDHHSEISADRSKTRTLRENEIK